MGEYQAAPEGRDDIEGKRETETGGYLVPGIITEDKPGLLAWFFRLSGRVLGSSRLYKKGTRDFDFKAALIKAVTEKQKGESNRVITCPRCKEKMEELNRVEHPTGITMIVFRCYPCDFEIFLPSNIVSIEWRKE